MSDEPPRWTLEELVARPLDSPLVWASPSVASRVELALPWTVSVVRNATTQSLPASARTLVVVGGGALIDQAKSRSHLERPDLVLIACASLWGSGAEVSPITVTLDANGRKVISTGAELVPNVRVVWPALAESVPDALVGPACGDVWAHAVEALCSPLATSTVVERAGSLVARLLETSIARDPVWFDLGAEACLVQAASSVGLVHGIAHTLEGPLRASGNAIGHAALCASFLWPALCLGQSLSTRLADRCATAKLDPRSVIARARELHDPALYARASPFLARHWNEILRDPCTRTNGALIRPGHLEYFMDRGFA